jgi:hypothetical protein
MSRPSCCPAWRDSATRRSAMPAPLNSARKPNAFRVCFPLPGAGELLAGPGSSTPRPAHRQSHLRPSPAKLAIDLITSRIEGEATGILMAKHNVTRAGAASMLRNASNSSRRELSEIAAGVTHAGDLDALSRRDAYTPRLVAPAVSPSSPARLPVSAKPPRAPWRPAASGARCSHGAPAGSRPWPTSWATARSRFRPMSPTMTP